MEEERGGTLGIVQIPECTTEAEPRRGVQTLRRREKFAPEARISRITVL